MATRPAPSTVIVASVPAEFSGREIYPFSSVVNSKAYKLIIASTPFPVMSVNLTIVSSKYDEVVVDIRAFVLPP